MEGYDQSQVLGNASTQSYPADHLPIDFLDIGIGITEGELPFNFTAQSGLLASGNSSIGISMSANVEATAPYLSMYLRSTHPKPASHLRAQYWTLLLEHKRPLLRWHHLLSFRPFIYPSASTIAFPKTSP